MTKLLSAAGAGSWVTPAFADGGWKLGLAPMGYDLDGFDIAYSTTLGTNSNIASGTAYYYFRYRFCLTAAGLSKVGVLGGTEAARGCGRRCCA